MDKKFIYLDNSATTSLSPAVLDVMMPFLKEEYGNPSSIYELGRKSKSAIEDAREKVAKAINANAREIFFTGSGSEADNWAIKGIAAKYKNKGNHIISTKIEHHAVLHTLEYLAKNGYDITYLDVNENGIVDPKDVENAITDNTILITVMFANNEIGTIQPIKEIGEIAKRNSIVFHTDAVQAVGSVPIDVADLGADMLTMSAHKFHGPKGVGALYIRKGLFLDNFIHGGAQERGKRASTENVAGIVGLGEALKSATENMEEKTKKILALRDKLIDGVLSSIPYVRLNGDRNLRLPGNTNFSFEFIEGESLLLMLDLKGVAASSGSACTSGSLDPSHVLLAIGLPHEIAHGSLRLSIGTENIEDDIDYVLEVLPGIVSRLRDMSPLYENRK